MKFVVDILDRILFSFRLKWYPFIHSFSCDGEMNIYIPNDGKSSECFMSCNACNKKHHLANVEPDDNPNKMELREGDKPNE